jgi:hypothetical protein
LAKTKTHVEAEENFCNPFDKYRQPPSRISKCSEEALGKTVESRSYQQDDIKVPFPVTVDGDDILVKVILLNDPHILLKLSISIVKFDNHVIYIVIIFLAVFFLFVVVMDF